MTLAVNQMLAKPAASDNHHSARPPTLILIVAPLSPRSPRYSIDSELSSVAFTIANGGMTAGLKVSVFLTSGAIDLVRRGGQTMTVVAPLDPLARLIDDFQKRGGTIWACTPCVKSRGYEQTDLIEGVIITGASAMHAQIKEGAATLSF